MTPERGQGSASGGAGPWPGQAEGAGAGPGGAPQALDAQSPAPEAIRSSRPPSPRQVDVLRFIAEQIDGHGYPPTRREICLGIGIGPKSTLAVDEQLARLARKGLLRVTPKIARGIAITTAGRIVLQSAAPRAHENP
jgi:LexA DNA binding domain